MPSYKKDDLNGFIIDDSGWEKSSGGNTCKAKRKKDNAKVFIKQYTGLKEPIMDASTSATLFAKKMEKFERLVYIRSEVNQRMRDISGHGGNIIIPYNEFVYDHLYTEVSEFVPGLMSPEDILALSDKEKLQFVMTAVNALQAVHDKHVIHMDIKPPNVIAVRNSYGIAVGKIIDFDNSLLKDLPIPSETGGDQIYMSPELAYYASTEGDPEVAKLISEKTDVFSMGLTLHYYLTGGMQPGYTGVTEPGMKKRIQKKRAENKPVFAWEVLLGDGKLVMDPSLPEWISEVIMKMMECEPDKRPTCREVFAIISDRSSGSGKKVDDHFDPPRSTDSIEWNEDKLRSDGYTGIHYSSSMNKYELTKNRSVIKRMDVAKLKSEGYAKPIEIRDEFEEPIPEDCIVWDVGRLKSMGYTGIHAVGGGKYSVTQNGRSLLTCDTSYLVAHKFAKRNGEEAHISKPSTPVKHEATAITSPPGFDDPDPNDGIISWNIDKLNSRMYTGIRSLGEGKYALYSGKNQQGIYEASRLIKLGYAIGGVKKEKDCFESPDPADEIKAWNETKLKARGYTGIRSIGGGNYILICNGRNQGEYSAERLIRLGYALKD